MARSILKPHATLFAATFRICDPLLTVIVGFVAHRAYLETFTLPDHYLVFLVIGALGVGIVLPLFRLYEPQRGSGVADEMRRLTFAWLLLAAMAGGAIFATKVGETYSRVWVGAWLAGGFAATAMLRLAVRWTLRALRLRGLNQRHIAIVGAGTLGRNVAARLAQAPWAGLRIVRFYDDDPSAV